MDYGTFKGIQFLLFFGAAIGLGAWQLYSVRRATRSDTGESHADTEHADASTHNKR